jgi:thiol-disulfide isomerase/thioredoxin
MVKIVLVTILAFCLSVFGFQEKPGNQNHQGNNYQKAPDFELTTLDGKSLKLSDYNGKIVILDFWATWCGPCRRGIPDLVEIQKEYNDDVVVIGISLDQENTQDQLQPFVEYFNINYPIVLWSEKVVEDYGNIGAIPTSFIIDKDGNIVNKFVGLMPKESFVEQINSILKKS